MLKRLFKMGPLMPYTHPNLAQFWAICQTGGDLGGWGPMASAPPLPHTLSSPEYILDKLI